MFSWQRITYVLGLALLEASLAALALILLGRPLWLPLVGVVLAGAAGDDLAQRWLRAERQTPLLLALGLFVSGLLAKSQVSGGFSPFAGWGTLAGALVAFDAQTWLVYVLWLVGLYAFWRGTRLLMHDSSSLHRLFGRTIVVLLLIIGFGGLSGSLAAAQVARATAYVFTFFGVGLLTIALTGATDEHGAQLRRMDWRGFATLAATISLIMVLGLLLASLFGDQAALVARAIWQVIAVVTILVVSPILIALAALITWLLSLLNADEMARMLQQMQQRQQQQALDQMQQSAGVPGWLLVPVEVFCALVPVLLLIALFVLFRRQRARKEQLAEERESLWNLREALHDMRALFANFGNPFARAEGLRATLARLRGSDPVSRIRRSYVRLLLLGEAEGAPRAPAQTPREYEQPISATRAGVAAAVARLTRAYERARYHSSSATAAEADAAEQAWGEIEGRR